MTDQTKIVTTEAHHALMAQLDETATRFAGRLDPAERLAIVAQFLGQLIAELPEQYDPESIMTAVSGNMAAGNRMAADKGKRTGLIAN